MIDASGLLPLPLLRRAGRVERFAGVLRVQVDDERLRGVLVEDAPLPDDAARWILIRLQGQAYDEDVVPVTT